MKNALPKELERFTSLKNVTITKWYNIEIDENKIIVASDRPEFIGKNLYSNEVMANDLELKTVDNEKIIIVSDGLADRDYFALNNGTIVEYVGEDYWSNPLFENKTNSRVYGFVNGCLYSMTSEEEPVSPLKLGFQLRDDEFKDFDFDEVQKVQYHLLNYKTSAIRYFPFIKDTAIENSNNLIALELCSFKNNLYLLFDAESETEIMYDLNLPEEDKKVLKKYAKLILNEYVSSDKEALELLTQRVVIGSK